MNRFVFILKNLTIDKLRWERYKYLVDHNPRKILDKIWMKQYGYTVDWKNPRDLNEKIEWLICYGDTSLWTLLADKYRVREYITQKGMAHILPILYGVWDDARSIDFSVLPDKFVLKCNHDSGSCHIINKQRGCHKEQIITFFNQRLKYRFGYNHCEPHYNKIKPLIIAEEFLESKEDDFSASIVDYKIWCFDGKPYCIWTLYNRDQNGIDSKLFDLNWENHPEHLVFTSYYRNGKGYVPKPSLLDEMLTIASVLTKGLPQVRIDFYIINNKIYFGEYTLTSHFGRMINFTHDFLVELGHQVKLPR